MTADHETGPNHHHESYTHGHHPSVLSSHEWRTVANSDAYLIPDLVPGLHVLDIGCGPGTITVDLAQRVFPGHVTGVDAAEIVLEKARAHARDAGVDNVDFVVGDTYALDAEDDTYDLVHIHQMLHHLSDPVEALGEARRVAKPAGLVAAREVDYAGAIWYPLLPGLAKWAALYQKVHRSHGGEPDAGRRLKSWAMDAGFSEVDSTASVWCFSSTADREFWGGMWEKRVLESSFAVDAVDGGFATPADLTEISVAWREWADNPRAWLILPHGEVRCRA
ncbi:class I SAM-dependent methyltransferase [Homoserinimonas sp. OAct 916]|uniref:class I SAM-dependent methyltransferase n=1 Tax=Homoserinimonas sp. OAct 916 TaxID=2211450 RepID=UPI000DBE2C8B|nr:class I SAM-dependent methyltransferase [Homoserinimonas sp. OAct 916]